MVWPRPNTQFFHFHAILSGPNLPQTLQITLILSLPTQIPYGLAQTLYASFPLSRNPVWPKPPTNTPNPPDFIPSHTNSLWFGPDLIRNFPTFTQSCLAQTVATKATTLSRLIFLFTIDYIASNSRKKILLPRKRILV